MTVFTLAKYLFMPLQALLHGLNVPKCSLNVSRGYVRHKIFDFGHSVWLLYYKKATGMKSAIFGCFKRPVCEYYIIVFSINKYAGLIMKINTFYCILE